MFLFTYLEFLLQRAYVEELLSKKRIAKLDTALQKLEEICNILFGSKIEESLKIIEQLIDNIPEGSYQEKMKPIIRVPEGSYYAAVEGSRGEFGVFLESHGDKTPYRLHFRSTGLPLVSTVDTICRGAKIADLIAIGGTLDYVVPDIDR